MKSLFSIVVYIQLSLFLTLLIGCDNTPEVNSFKKKALERDSVLSTTVYVIDKIFVPEGNKSSSPIYVKSGNVAIPIESSGSTSEKHLLFIKDDLSKIYEIDDLQLWGQVNKGDTAILYYNNKNDMFNNSYVNYIDIKPVHK